MAFSLVACPWCLCSSRLRSRATLALYCALLMPPEEGGVIGYNAAFDGFNYAHHRVSITQGLQRLATCSRQANPPGLAM